MNPLVSIIVPCYNQGQYLGEALESVSNQTFSDWECLIVDDGSVDDTAAIAKTFTEIDSRFVYLFKENGGVSSTRNFGIEAAKGAFIQFLDSDDILDKTKLELSLLQLEVPENKEVKIVISNFRMIVDNQEASLPPFCVLDESFFNVEGFLFQWNVAFSLQMQCGFFDAALFKTIRFPENLSAQEDWVVWVSLFKASNKAVFIDKPLAFYRINPSSRMMTLGIDDNKIKVLESFKAILSYDEYYRFSFDLISRCYDSNEKFRIKLNEIKKSNSYQTGLMIKKGFKKIGLLKPARSFFRLLFRLKAK